MRMWKHFINNWSSQISDDVLNRLVSSPPQEVPDANRMFPRSLPKRRSGHNGVATPSNNYVRPLLNYYNLFAFLR